ncbi:MAG: hypothetical protein AB1758_09855 [Candidatus Eremiobacterota bacterium]
MNASLKAAPRHEGGGGLLGQIQRHFPGLSRDQIVGHVKQMRDEGLTVSEMIERGKQMKAAGYGQAPRDQATLSPWAALLGLNNLLQGGWARF